MTRVKLPQRTIESINGMVKLYKKEQSQFKTFARQVHDLFSEHPLLVPYIHSMKYRVKKPDHLRRKLLKKAREAYGRKEKFLITEANLYEEIDDLAGVRILHLHTEQMTEINASLLKIIEEQKYVLISGPVANTWDIEYEKFFKGLNMQISERDTMYTSVHYVLGANNIYQTRCELQVRTLMEEVWGEVSHKINYPIETSSISCKEQIKVLARVTSSCTRLVDSIFKSYHEHQSFHTSKK